MTSIEKLKFMVGAIRASPWRSVSQLVCSQTLR